MERPKVAFSWQIDAMYVPWTLCSRHCWARSRAAIEDLGNLCRRRGLRLGPKLGHLDLFLSFCCRGRRSRHAFCVSRTWNMVGWLGALTCTILIDGIASPFSNWIDVEPTVVASGYMISFSRWIARYFCFLAMETFVAAVSGMIPWYVPSVYRSLIRNWSADCTFIALQTSLMVIL